MKNSFTRIYFENVKPLINSPSFLILFSTATVAFVFLLGDLVFTRRFTQEDFGTWRQIILIVSLGTTLISFGMPEGYRYFISFDPDSGPQHAIKLIITTFIIALLLQFFLIAGGIDLLISTFNNPSLKYIVYTLPAIFVVVTLSRAIRYLMINNHDTVLLFKYSLICLIISAIFIALTWFVYIRLTPEELWLWMSCFIIVVYLSLFLPYIFVYFKQKVKIKSRKEWFSILLYLKVGFPIYISTFIGVLTLNIDKTIVSSFTDVTTFAIYAIGAVELPIVGMIGASIAQKIFPQLITFYREGNISAAKRTWLNTTLKATHITYPIILIMMIASKPLFELLFTEKYIEAVPIFQTYLLAGLWRNTQYGSLIIASGKTKWTFYYSILCLAFNITLSLLLFYFFGILGVALGAFFASCFMALIQLRHEGLLESWLNKIIFNKIIAIEILAIFIVYLVYNQSWV